MGGGTKAEQTARRLSQPLADLSAPTQTGRVPKILCVDDEPPMLAILSRSLRSNFEVVTADDPVLALSLLERTLDFSVIISDMKMPQMDGGEFLARVKKLAPAITRLALTACLERQLAPDDVFGILTKPCPLNLLQESVSAAVQHHELISGRLGSDAPASMHGMSAALGSGVRLRALAESVGLSAHDLDPVSSASLPSRGQLSLRLFGADTELKPGVTTLGRSKSCHIVVDDPRISSRHARFVCSWRGVTLQDVSGVTGGVRLKGERFAGARYINLGDWIGIGPFDAEVRAAPASEIALELVQHAPARDEQESGEQPGEDAAALEMLSGVAEKFFRLDQSIEAERILEGPLESFLRHCEGGRRPSALDTETAVALAVRLAEARRETRWIEYTLRLFASVGRTIPPSIVERLEPLTLAP
jgi:CheY-like chemotaxis protein/pSer/pThr/pTyr-binding forkhead associated (FHA) protein